MKFHPEKCTVLHIRINRRNVIKSCYTLHGYIPEAVESGKYLGVTQSNDLSWKIHVEAIAAKASNTLGFLRRNLQECSQSQRNYLYRNGEANFRVCFFFMGYLPGRRHLQTGTGAEMDSSFCAQQLPRQAARICHQDGSRPELGSI